MSAAPWNRDEDEQLMTLYLWGYSAARIHEYIPDRSRNAIIARLWRLGFCSHSTARKPIRTARMKRGGL